MSFRPVISLCAMLFLLGACGPDQQAETPKPQLPTENAIGYFCNMLLFEHQGPKSQIHLRGTSEPLWFTSVRDGIAYTRLPEESLGVSKLYVTAIDSATEFDLIHPERSTAAWVDAEWALYVIDSELRGGMAEKEAFPFRDGAQATLFVEMHGGKVVRLSDIPDDYVLGNSATLPLEEQTQPDHNYHSMK